MELCFGPMSSEIIKALFRYSHQYNFPITIIASKNQIDYDGGYVGGWNTEQFTQYLTNLKHKYPSSQITIARDHCGPGFKLQDHTKLTDTYKTLEEDIKCGFDIIHIDFSNYMGDKIKQTCLLMEYANSLNPNIEFEIGTDIIGEIPNYDKIRSELINFQDFDALYYVVNTGSHIKENKQIGVFYESSTKNCKYILDEFGVGLKEHNADYLSFLQIQKRIGLVDAMNVAPQLGVVQTLTLLTECQKFGINVDDFVNLVYNNSKWQKWDNGNLRNNPYLATVVAGHYHFASDIYKRLMDQLDYQRFSNKIYRQMIDIINHYRFNSILHL